MSEPEAASTYSDTPSPQKRGAVARGLSLFATDKRARVAARRATFAAWFALGAWIAAGLALAVAVAGRGM